MSNYLNIPADLQSLMEKREREDRRVADRRKEEELASGDDSCSERRGTDRRSETTRREGDG